MLLICYQRSNGVTDSAMDGVSKIFKQLLPPSNLCPPSFKVVKRIVENKIDSNFKLAVIHKKMCGDCFGTFDGLCINECKDDGRYSKPAEYFVFNIAKQLGVIVSKYGSKILRNLAVANSESSCLLTDLLTGELYQNYYPIHRIRTYICIWLSIRTARSLQMLHLVPSGQ